MERHNSSEAGPLVDHIHAEDSTPWPIDDAASKSMRLQSVDLAVSARKLWVPELARTLADDGRFKLQIRPRGQTLSDTTSWFDTCRALCKSGLWLNRNSLCWRAPILGFSIRLPIGSLLPLATMGTIEGVRMERRYHKVQESIRHNLEIDGHARSICASSSMSPTFDIGDRLHFEPCDSPRRGDIVLMLGHNALRVHRVMSRLRLGESSWIVHKGDSPTAKAGLAAGWRVIGKVVSIDEVGDA